MTCRDPNGIMDNDAPILPIVIERIPTAVANVVGIIEKIMYIIMCPNILEGILYWRISRMI